MKPRIVFCGTDQGDNNLVNFTIVDDTNQVRHGTIKAKQLVELLNTHGQERKTEAQAA